MAIVNVSGALGGGSEPCRQVAEQVVLVFADPCDVAVRSEQDRRRVQFPADVRDVVDPIRPSCHGEFAGLVQQEPAAFASELVETAPRQRDVTQSSAEQFGSLAEVGRGHCRPSSCTV
jgi:hypothetical protein